MGASPPGCRIAAGEVERTNGRRTFQVAATAASRTPLELSASRARVTYGAPVRCGPLLSLCIGLRRSGTLAARRDASLVLTVSLRRSFVPVTIALAPRKLLPKAWQDLRQCVFELCRRHADQGTFDCAPRA